MGKASSHSVALWGTKVINETTTIVATRGGIGEELSFTREVKSCITPKSTILGRRTDTEKQKR